MELLKVTLVSIVILMLTSCSTLNKLGYWKSSYTKSVSLWQCVETFLPYPNKEC